MHGRRVFVTRVVPEAGIARLVDAGLRVEVNPLPRPLRPEELLARIGRYDAILSQVADQLDEAALRAALPRCRIIAQCAVGYDNIDVAAAHRLGIVITNTPDVLTETTADLTWALILAAARRLGEGERLVRAGVWRGWGMLEMLGTEVHGATLGIVGAGRIGCAVARRSGGFGMKLLYHSRRASPEMQRLGGRQVRLDELLAGSDFVSLHVPLRADTRHLIDAAALARMKRTAILINTTRGGVIDEDALIEALREGRLAAAGLDVYAHEPHVPAGLAELENVVLLPHIGSATPATRNAMARRAADNVVAVLSGKPPLHPVLPPSAEA